MKALTNELYSALAIYLEAKPYREVKKLLDGLVQAPDVDITFTNITNNGPTEDKAVEEPKN